MGKGIVANKPTLGSNTGRLMVTDGTDLKPVAAPGTITKYDEINKANDGDLVSFTIDPATGMPSKMVQDSVGKVYSGDVSEDITVGAGESVLLKDANYEGTIENNGGYLTVVGQSTLTGIIRAKTASAFIMMNGANFTGKLESSNGGSLSVVSSTVTGKITSSGNAYVGIQNCTLAGQSNVTGAATSNCFGNTLNGSPISGCGR